MKLKPQISLVFDGRCEDAIRLYERCLNGRIPFIMPWADSPAASVGTVVDRFGIPWAINGE